MEIVRRANTLCEGCLSRNRTLAIITNDEIKQFYCTIVQEKKESNSPLVLCWECIANIQRYISFKRQCNEAHDTLHMITPASVKSLSKLTVVKNNVVINIYDTQELCNRVDLTQKNESQNCINYKKLYQECISNRVILSHKNESQIWVDSNQTYEESYKHYVTEKQENLTDKVTLTRENEINSLDSHKKETDITFIKIERDDVIDDELCYLGDDFDRVDDDDDKNVTTIVKSDNEEKIIKSKRSKKKKTEDDFDDSDEEPLNNKRSKTVRGRKRKRKKENGIPKEKKPKGPRPSKREKPPGVVSNARVTKKIQQLNMDEGQLEMVILSWDEVEEERQKALRSEAFTRHEYRCADCIVGFNHKFKLTNHMKKHDPSSGELICNICQVRCKDSHALCAHRRRHRVRWRCCACGATCSRASVCADHVTRAHGGAAPAHVCAACGHHETTLGKLRNHIKNHAERQKCELCGKTFRDRTSLRTHLFIHKGEKEYSCPRCDKKFLFKKAMEVHLVTHDAPAHLYCYQCDLTFKNRMSYTQHMKYSLKHIDPAKLKYACQLCDKKFVKATRLEEHNLAVHLKATPIKCTMPECNFACSSRPVLRTHIRMVHRNARALRNHVCDTCGKTYTTKKTLEGHIRSHTGERPFKCGLCPSTFGYEAALYNHNKLVHLKGKVHKRSQPPLQLQIPEPPTDIANIT